MAALSSSPVLALRALAFQLFFYVWTTIYCLGVLPAYAFLSPAAMRVIARAWQRVTIAGLRVIVGLTYEIRGREQLPQAGTHRQQTPVGVGNPGLPCAGPEVAVGLKEELTWIPVFGWYLLRSGNIKIDRGAGSRAIRSLIEGGKRAVGEVCPC